MGLMILMLSLMLGLLLCGRCPDGTRQSRVEVLVEVDDEDRLVSLKLDRSNYKALGAEC